MSSGRAEQLTIHVWVDDETQESSLRALVEIAGDGPDAGKRTLTLAEHDAVVELVQEWLHDLLRGPHS